MKKRLRAMFCDNMSIMRGKYLPNGKIGNEETRFCRAVYGIHFDNEVLPSPGSYMLQGLPDMICRWEESDIRDGWERETKVVIGDLYDQNGAPLPECGRGALKRAVEEWRAKGLTPKVGIELEAYAFQRDDEGKLVPYDSHGVTYGTGSFLDPIGFTEEIWAKADELGFRLEMMTGEYERPQFEFTLEYDDAVKAVDDAVLFRQMAREVAFEKGIYLTFMPKPIAHLTGNGLHVNFSFTDENGKNVICTGEKGGIENMSDLARSCVAGLIHHHKGLAGLLAPSTNSYERLGPQNFSGYWKNWGGDHRNTTNRISHEGGAAARIEHRMADASSNLYVAVAAVLQAARLGVENRYELGPHESGDGFENTEATEGTARNLTDAMNDLEADKVLSSAVGQEIVDNHVFMRRAEVGKTEGMSIDLQLPYYAYKF